MLASFYLAMVHQEGGMQSGGDGAGAVIGVLVGLIVWAIIITAVFKFFRRRDKARQAAKDLGTHVADTPVPQPSSMLKDVADELKDRFVQQIPKPVRNAAGALKEKFDASRQQKSAPAPTNVRPAPRPDMQPAWSAQGADGRPSASPGGGEIFISYASADRPTAAALAEALQNEGWSVWWDRSIPPGKTFDEVIEAALTAASCVVVLWSKDSVTSDWVKVECAEAAKHRILIPAMIAEVSIPLEFRRLQAASLLDWPGPHPHPGFESLAASVAALLGKPRASSASPPDWKR